MDQSLQELFAKVKISDVMNKLVVTIYEDEDLSLAQTKFINHGVTHLIVLNRRDELVGVLSQKYLYKTHSPRKIIGDRPTYDKSVIVDGDSFFDKTTLDKYILRTIMKKDPFAMRPQDTILHAIVEMSRLNLGCIPVINKNRSVTGVITSNEVIKFVAYILAE